MNYRDSWHNLRVSHTSSTPQVSAINAPTTASIGTSTLSALLGFAVFSGHDALIKSIPDYSVFQIGFFSVLFSFVPFTLFLAVNRKPFSLWPNKPKLVAIRCCSILGSMLFAFYAFRTLPLTQVYALIFSAPLIITVLAIPVLGEQVKLFRWMAVLIGFVGVIVVLGTQSGSLGSGHIAGILCAFCSATTAVVTRKIGAGESTLTLIVYPLLVNLTVCGLAMAPVYKPMPGMVLFGMCSIGLLAVMGQSLLIYAYRNAPAQYIAPFQYSQMVWAVIFGMLFFAETPQLNVLIGAAIIIASGLLIVLRELRVSSNKPILNTRNFRSVSGPQAFSTESDQADTSKEQDP